MRVIVIEGIIGAGKTTLIEKLAERLRQKGHKVAIAPEPVNQWREDGALAMFYSDMERYAYTFQTHVFLTRVQAIRKAVQKTPDADVLLTERSPYTDRYVFMETLSRIITEQEMKLYNVWCDFWITTMPEGVMDNKWEAVFVDPPVNLCSNRMNQRGRKEEDKVSEEYQKELHQAYETFLAGGTYRQVVNFPNTEAITDRRVDDLVLQFGL